MFHFKILYLDLVLQTYYINTPDDFVAINQLEDKEIILNRSIDFKYYSQNVQQQRLFGSFDGQNHIIYNLYISDLYLQDDEQFASVFKPSSTNVSISNVLFYNLKISRGDSSTNHNNKVSLGLLISQVIDCNIFNVSIYNGNLYSLGHENVQMIGGFIGNCIGICNVTNSMVYADVQIFHNTNYQLIQMPIGGVIGLCNQICNIKNTYVNFNVRSESIYTGLTIGGLIGVSKADKIQAINCIIYQNHEFRYSTSFRLGGIFGDDRSKEVNLTEVQTSTYSQINNTDLMNNIGLISGNNICQNSTYINLLLEGYGYIKSINQDSIVKSIVTTNFGANTSIKFIDYDGVNYISTEISKDIYTYRSIPGIKQCTKRSFQDTGARHIQIDQSGQQYYQYDYSIQDQVCSRLIMYSINQDFSDLSICDEHNINQSCDNNAFCRRYEITQLDSYFQYKTVYQCKCADEYVFYNQTCILKSQIQEQEEIMPSPTEQQEHQNPLQWLKDIQFSRNTALIIGVGIPLTIIFIIISILILYCIRKRNYYYVQQDSNQEPQDKNDKKLSLKPQESQQNIKQQKQLTLKPVDNKQQEQKSQSQKPQDQPATKQQKRKVVKKHHKSQNNDKTQQINNSSQSANITSKTSQEQQPKQNSQQQVQQQQQQPQQQQQQQTQQQPKQETMPQVQTLQLITDIPVPDEQPQKHKKVHHKKVQSKFELCDKDYYNTDNVNQYLNVQTLGHLPSELPTYVAPQQTKKVKKVIKIKSSKSKQ